MELWDLYDGDRKLIGRTHDRADPMTSGELHIVVAVWTVNSKNDVLLTLRHPEKEVYPNCRENSGSSILTGETSRQDAVRELREETGITADENELCFLGTYVKKTAFVDSYIMIKDIAISDLTMQNGETVGAKWVTLTELDAMIEDGSIAYPECKRLVPSRGKFEEFIFNE